MTQANERKRAPVEHFILFFQGGTDRNAPKHGQESRSLFSGNYGYIRNLRRSLPKGTSTLHPLEGAMGTLSQRRHAEGKSVQKLDSLSHRLEEHHPCPAELDRKPLKPSSKLAIID